MKKAVIIILEVLTLACWGGAFAVQYFTEHKLGMTRWVNYHYGKLTEAVPYDTLKYALLALIVAAAALLAWRAVRKMGTGGVRRAPLGAGASGGKVGSGAASTIPLVAIALAVVAAFAAVALLVTHEVTRADYLIVALGALAALFQVAILARL